jgi:D-aspartate ligase
MKRTLARGGAAVADIADRRPAQSEPTGALVVGGDHPGLGVVRSLGRRGIPVHILDDQFSVAFFSKYVTRVTRVPDLRDERKTIEALLETGRRFNLKDWVLFPTRDETVAALSRYRDELSAFYRVTTPEWDTIRWAWNKKNTYELAERLNIPCPETFNPRSKAELEPLYSKLPLAIKPAVKENFFYATGVKAWRANTRDELDNLFERASKQLRPEEILVQEIIPGDGQRQLSYCAFFRDGHAHSALLARRMRQHPREFGRSATYVETVEAPEIEELSERFLRAINFYGLVEIEYKQDPRDGKYKLLDVNARTWGFHSLGWPAGVDFPYVLFADQLGKSPSRFRAPAGIGWLRLITDVPVVISDMLRGAMTPGEYFRSLRNTRTESVFVRDDVMPSIAELVMLPYLVSKKYL